MLCSVRAEERSNIFEHEWQPLLFVIGGHDEGDLWLGMFECCLRVLGDVIFMSVGEGDGDGFVLARVKVFFPVFVGLDEP